MACRSSCYSSACRTTFSFDYRFQSPFWCFILRVKWKKNERAGIRGAIGIKKARGRVYFPLSHFILVSTLVSSWVWGNWKRQSLKMAKKGEVRTVNSELSAGEKSYRMCLIKCFSRTWMGESCRVERINCFLWSSHVRSVWCVSCLCLQTVSLRLVCTVSKSILIGQQWFTWEFWICTFRSLCLFLAK